jgi:hypothetical protein
MIVCALAALRGRDDERLAAATVLADWALSVFVHRTGDHGTQWAVLLVDSGQFAVFVWLALRSRWYWPLFLAAFGLLQLVTHLAHAVDDTVSGWAYFTSELLWSYLNLFTIGVASWMRPRSLRNAAYHPTGAARTEVPGATRR